MRVGEKEGVRMGCESEVHEWSARVSCESKVRE